MYKQPIIDRYYTESYEFSLITGERLEFSKIRYWKNIECKIEGLDLTFCDGIKGGFISSNTNFGASGEASRINEMDPKYLRDVINDLKLFPKKLLEKGIEYI